MANKRLSAHRLEKMLETARAAVEAGEYPGEDVALLEMFPDEVEAAFARHGPPVEEPPPDNAWDSLALFHAAG